MQRNEIYQLWDIEAGQAAGPLMLQKRAAPAIRDFHAILSMKDTLPGKYPEHFELKHLGSQDLETGLIEAKHPETIATGTQWKEAQRPTD